MSSAMQMGVIHFARFPPKKRGEQSEVLLCPSEGTNKGLLAEVENTG